MPTYRVRDTQTGRTLRLTGDSPPTEQELEEIFASQRAIEPQPDVRGFFGNVPAEAYARGERNIAGNIIERPAATARGAIRGNPRLAILGPLAGFTATTGLGGREAQQRAIAASLNPARERSFQEEAIERYYQDVARKQPGRYPNVAQVVGGMVPSAAGLAADVVTSPVDALLSVLGLTPQARQATTAISTSRPGQAIGQVLTKPRRTPLEILRGRPQSIGVPSTLAKPNVARTEVLGKIREGFLNAPKLAGKEFETQLVGLKTIHPNQTIDLSEGLAQAIQARAKNPAFESLLQRAVRNDQESALIQSIVNQPEVASNLTLDQAQLLKQPIQRALKTRFEQVSPDFWGAHLDMLDLWHSIRAAELKAFPELEDVFQAYSTTLGHFRKIKPVLKESGLEGAILSDFGNKAEILTAIRELVPEETLQLMLKLQKANARHTLFRRLKTAAGVGAAGTFGAGVIGKLIFRDR